LTLKLFYNQENLSQYKKIYRLVRKPEAFFRVAGARRRKRQKIVCVLKSYLLSYRCKDRQQQQQQPQQEEKKRQKNSL